MTTEMIKQPRKSRWILTTEKPYSVRGYFW